MKKEEKLEKILFFMKTEIRKRWKDFSNTNTKVLTKMKGNKQLMKY